MRVGLYYFLQAVPGRPAQQIFLEELEQMVLAERLGFDSVWLTEHHFADYGLSAAPGVIASAVAARTERIKIGLAVYVMPFHHPLRLAEETATLDILSQGRLIVGIGRGNRPLEFVGHGVAQTESRSRLEEGVAVLLQAWTQDQVTFHGQHWTIDNIAVHPHPVTRPHPPLAFAATSLPTVTWAAQHGYPVLSSGLLTPLAAVLQQRATYEQAVRAAGHSEATLGALLERSVLTKHVYVAPTDAEALHDAEGPERWYLDSFVRSLRSDGLPGLDARVRRDATAMADRIAALRWEQLVEDSLLIGSPETVCRKVSELQRAGVGELVCWMNFGGISHDKAVRSMELFATEVLPSVRRGG